MGRGTLSIALLATTLSAVPMSFAMQAGAATDPFEAMAVHRIEVPELAPDMGFAAPDGRPARVRDLRGKVVLLGFFTTW